MTSIQIEARDAPTPPRSSMPMPLLRLGFRPFYLLAAIFALLAIPLWLLQWSGELTWPGALAGLNWHAHEMLFGYAVAVISGFLLTAVRNWTGLDTPSGKALAALALLWLSARVLLPWAPLWLAAPLDLIFLPCLAWTLWLRVRQGPRNHFAPLLLLGLALCNLGFYLGLFGWLRLSPLAPLHAALYLITTLEVIIAGRVLPMFTRNAAPGVRQARYEWLERWLAPLTAIALGADLLPLPRALLLLLNLTLALLHLTRWLGWGPRAAWNRPLLWILHLGYFWIIIGFALAAAATLGWVSWIAVQHAFAVGALGGLTLGMITRTALGHSGRMLVSGRIEFWAYGAMLAAAGCRLAGLLWALPGGYFLWLCIAGGCWCGAFALYLVKYAPILLQARADGKPG